MTTAVIGAGWLGVALGASLGVEPIPRRAFRPDDICDASRVIVASGRAAIPSAEGLPGALRLELAHLGAVLDAVPAGARVVVLGSSDVAGLAPVVDGRTAAAPRTVYATVKAALEDECRRRAHAGAAITCVRLAPVHGPGKARTAALVALARHRVVPLPNGGRHSTGFVLVDDVVRAIRWLVDHDAAPVVGVGAGEVPLRGLLAELAALQGRRFRGVTVPVPARFLARGPRLPDRVEWLLRLALPRSVMCDVPVPITPWEKAAVQLVEAC